MVNVNPLRIIHATPPRAKVDSVIGTWKYAAFLNEVEYEKASTETPQKSITGVIYADNGLPVKLRKQPNKASVWLAWVPVGTHVEVLEHGKDWCKVKAGSKIGYMMTEFITWG